MAFFGNIREEELKLKVGEMFFSGFDRTAILGNVDFCIAAKIKNPDQMTFDFDRESFLWAEAKRGSVDLLNAFTQLVLTIGKARTFDRFLPPFLLGAFDADKFGFVPYSDVIDVFYQNDFNWNVTPSDHTTKEFQQVRELIEKTIARDKYVFYYKTDANELTKFIKENFKSNKHNVSCIRVTKSNFVTIYLKWREAVMPTIAINWDNAKTKGILDADFYLADLLAEHDLTLKDKLNVVLRKTHYNLNRQIDELGLSNSSNAEFTDEQAKHVEFWNRYIRPPKREYWDYIIERRDLLIPQDVRERKGSFFTPAVWVAKAQEYLADTLGENWQEEYTIWDCCAGTGNLEAGLVNKYNVWASTLDKSDVDVMKDRIANGANLLESHVFQFDFLNDDFANLPEGLQKIINDPEKRKKLVIFINPPYAEAADIKQTSGTGKNKDRVATEHSIYKKAKPIIGNAALELFAQFFFRVYTEINGSVLAEFSTLKILLGQNFIRFNSFFNAKLLKLFLVPANTFDNVKGSFPIGFFIWDTSINERFSSITADVFDANDHFIGFKKIQKPEHFIIEWLRKYYDKTPPLIGYLRMLGCDIQNNRGVFLTSKLSANDIREKKYTEISTLNIIPICVYFTSRNCIPATWLNDRDQYLYPHNIWSSDQDFLTNCLAYTIFSNSNNIKSADGVNHWIPFKEEEVEARDKYESHFLLDFMSGKWQAENNQETVADDLFENTEKPEAHLLVFTPEAIEVFDAARELWRYYHKQENSNPNASFYDIREHFQGRNARGIMNPDSSDAVYTELLDAFKQAYRNLSAQIEPKIYEYGFLLK